MARTPTVYRWDDPGAPDLSALHTTNDERDLMYFHTVLKACLVTGYGAKAAAGWTMPHEETATAMDGNRFVLTNAAESGSLLYEGGAFSGGGAHRVDTLWACSAVPGLDAPVNAWSWNVKYADRNSEGSSATFHKTGLQYKRDCDAWVVIANENTCIVVCGRAAYDFNVANMDGVSASYSCLFIFGAMHDGFGGVLAPDSGNFYIAGGSKGDYDSYSGNTGMQSDLLTSIQGVTGLVKSGDHEYTYSNPNLIEAYNPINAWLPINVFYTVSGESNPINANVGRRTIAAIVPSYRKLLLNISSVISRKDFMIDNSFEYGVQLAYHGNYWILCKAYDDILDVFSLDPSDWGAS